MNEEKSISQDDFYRGKKAVCEEWFVNEGDLQSWARLRVFQDGTADVWDHGELWGFVNEASARFMIGEGHYVDLTVLKSIGKKPKCQPPRNIADATRETFHFGGDWNTGLG